VDPAPIRLRVLIADDDEAFAKVMALYLRTCGCAVTIVLGGRPLLAALGDEDFDLVVADVLMPDLPGTDACADAAAAGIDVPFVFMTADCDPELLARGRALSGRSVIRKPFQLERLDAVLEARRESSRR